MRAHVDIKTPTVMVTAKHDPERITIRVGSVYVTASIDEALTLATDIADAVETLRAAYPQGDANQ